MDRAAHSQAPRAAPEPIRIRPLLPAHAPTTAPEIIEALGLWDRPAGPLQRPHVMINMVSTVDGRASIAGRSGPIAGPADRELFHALRAPVDAVMAGAGTMRVERYGRIPPDASRMRMRRERGLSEEPLACIVSASLALPPDLPLLAEPEAHVVVLTPSDATLPDSAARIDYVRTGTGEELDLAAALAELRERRPDHPIETNVEFWAAVILDFAEVPPHMMPALFSCARTAGWCAHIMEQKKTGRLVRPSARYVGPAPRSPKDVEGWDNIAHT